MSELNLEDFLDELLFCLKKEDIVKTKALLQFITKPEINADIQKKVLHELSIAGERLVFPILEFLTTLDIPNPEIQESLYELILDKAYGNHDRIINYIIKDDKRNRLTYIKVAGDLILADTAPILEKFLEKSRDREIIIQAAVSLGSIGLQTSLAPLTKVLLAWNDTYVQQTAIEAIVQIDGKAAVDYLTSSITGSDETDYMKIKALGDIQNQYALKSLAGLLESTNINIRDAAVDQLIKIGGKAVPVLTAATSNAGTDCMVHLITTLGYIKDPKALPIILDIMKTRPADPNIRQAAYESMERIPSAKSAIALAVGIQDPVEAVRMSAALAMDKNISKVLVAGLKNIIREGNEEALNAVGALVDSKADNIFNFLLQEESFIQLSIKHVTTKTDQKTRDYFLNVLKNKNHQTLANKIADMLPGESKNQKIQKTQKTQKTRQASAAKSVQIYVVDDSKMMLKLYENKITGFGYSPTSFILPEEAVRQIYASKPDLVITDLNMPKINGLQLTRMVRKKYSSAALPIVMITTQSDVVESDKNSTLDKSLPGRAGINKVLHKPFSNEELQATIARLLPKDAAER